MKTNLTYLTLSGLMVIALAGFFSCSGGSDQTQQSDSAQKTEQTPTVSKDGVGRFKEITLAAIDPAFSEKGKSIFESKCSACHKTTAQKVVGPGLKGITGKRTPAWILNMITNPLEMTQKDPIAKGLLEEHLTQMTFQDVSDDDAKAILEFLRANDETPQAQL